MQTDMDLYPWQSQAWQAFSSQYHTKRVPHACIVTGVVGTGKSVFAKAMAARLLCDSTVSDDACGECHSCRLYTSGGHPDHTEIRPEEDANSIKIEQIRLLKDKQELTPSVAKWKTVIIEPAEKMTISAFNSLLKFLEEPEDNTLIILVTSKLHQLPITITSRCQRLDIQTPDADKTLAWLGQQTSIQPEDVQDLQCLSVQGPLAITSLIEQGVPEQLKQIRLDFDALLKSRANPIDLTKRWIQYDANVVFSLLQNIVKNELVGLQAQNRSTEAKRYWHIYDCIIAAIKLTSSSNNINKTLLIEQFMTVVMDKSLTQSITDISEH